MPFEVVEMLARVESVLRRYKKTNDELVEDDVVINFQSRSVTKAGKTLDLTHKEFELLDSAYTKQKYCPLQRCNI